MKAKFWRFLRWCLMKPTFVDNEKCLFGGTYRKWTKIIKNRRLDIVAEVGHNVFRKIKGLK